MPLTFAVVPAAGHSTRMGRPKLRLPLGERTVLEHVLGALQQTDVRQTVVVAGPHTADLAPLAEAAGSHVLVLLEPTADMRATVERGLQWLADRFGPRPDDRWLLVPADLARLEAAVVGQLLEARGAHQRATVIIPTYGGRRGHPVLIDWKHVAGIRAWPAGQGLDAYLRGQAAETVELAVADAGVLFDLDTPADYERLSGQRPG
ncbi:MAG TPA: nucleotidyltransferase family protein [Gemmataceae bacterium]|nr:nucleotidyltransferase family protein [Gemmataceae bacterium]